MMNWQRLLSGRRIGKELADPSHRPRSSFQVDHDRIIFSSAFRRLQDKTQVFPLAESDYVRTRLTHSLEVACVGRSLGTLAGRKIKEAAPDIHESDIGAIIAAAALAHDLGNPPFGHSGEQAIRHWFQNSPVAQPLRNELSEKELADIDRYEGNAHAFRVVTALQMPDNRGGMQLTYATLGAVAKYPLESLVPGIGMSQKGASTKKFNFFQTEKSLFGEVATQTGLIRRREDAAWWCRHPLAFLVEAADDICYHLIDFEDGYRSGIIPFDEIRATFLDLIGEPKTEQRLDGLSTRDEQVQLLWAKEIGRIVSEAAASFTTHEPELHAGEFDQPLISVIPSAARLERIGDREREAIYCHPKVVEVEAAGYEVLGGLLDTFVEAADEAARKGKEAQHRARTLLRLVPAQFIGPGGIVETDPYLRLLKLLDFVAGMTDSYAVSLYRRIRGISLPGRFV